MKRQEPCLNIITSACVDSMVNCCGIGELGDFSTREDAMEEDSEYDYLTSSYKIIPAKPATLSDVRDKFRGFKTVLATTIPSQKAAAQALKAVGFKKITTTQSREDPRRTITLWMWKDEKKREKKHGRKSSSLVA